MPASWVGISIRLAGGSVSGATLWERDERCDFMLMRRSSKPPASYNAFYSGWDATGAAVRNDFSIHHPEGDVKKISFDRDPAAKVSSGLAAWRAAWDDAGEG